MERRAFFKLAGLSAAMLAAGGALGACDVQREISTALTPVSAPDDGTDAATVVGQPAVSFTQTVDVLVVGSGVAGLSAAMAPLDAGRSVMIVDKQDLLGGESYDSNGVLYAANTKVQQDAGVKMTLDEAWTIRKQELKAVGVDDVDFAQKLFEEAREWADLLADDYGAQFADPKTYKDEDVSGFVLLPKNGLGDMESVMVPLRDGLSGKGATFQTGQRAEAFILSDTGSVCGMRFVATKGGAVMDVRARCVVLATGGFASSQPLVHTYTPDWERAGCYTTASMGEGQLLCSAVRGELENMDKHAPLTSDLPQAAAWGLFGPTVIVDTVGNRFAREDSMNDAADACYSEVRGYWWTVFDKQLTESSQSRSIAQLTSKQSRRLVGPCDSLEELSDEMGAPQETLKKTFERYDGMVDAGKDDDFGRTLFLDKLEGPYYAIKQLPVRYKTRGGVRTDDEGRALTAAGTVIPNVYCCGAVASKGVEGLASCGAFGLLVGRAVASALDERDSSSE